MFAGGWGGGREGREKREMCNSLVLGERLIPIDGELLPSPLTTHLEYSMFIRMAVPLEAGAGAI